jgi:hypothetical protein
MVEMSIEKQILEQVERLNLEQKRKVLDFARTLGETKSLKGTAAEAFATSAATVKFNPQDLQEIVQAIEELCEISGQERPD